MKPRRVVLTVEVETDAPVRPLVQTLKGWRFTNGRTDYHWKILQVQANVIQEAKAAPKRK